MSSIQITKRVLPEDEKIKFTMKQKLLLTINVLITLLSVFLLMCFARSIGFHSANEINRRELFFDCTDVELKFKALRYGDFWFLKNFVIGSKTRKTSCVDEITYVTQSDDYHSFFQQLPELIHSWQTHISVTLYTNTTDLIAIKSAIYYARNCISESGDISKFVTFHILLPWGQLQHVASTENISWTLELNCNSGNALLPTRTLEQKQILLYPMNIAANLARKAANTALLMQSPLNVLLFRGNDEFLHNIIINEFCLYVYNAQKRIRCAHNLDNAKVIFLLSTYKLNGHLDGRKLMRNNHNVNVKQLTSAGHLRYPIYIGHKSVPYFDERFIETDDDYRFLQNYTMYLQNYSYRQLADLYFLNYVAVIKNPSPRSEQQLTIKSDAVKRMMREYSILFGSFGEE